MEEDTKHYSYYTVMPTWLLMEKKVPSRAKLLYGRIVSLSDKTGYCWASNDYLSKETGIPKRTMQVYLMLLEQYKLIKRVIKKRIGGGWTREIWLVDKFVNNSVNKRLRSGEQGADSARQGAENHTNPAYQGAGVRAKDCTIVYSKRIDKSITDNKSLNLKSLRNGLTKKMRMQK